MSKRLRYYFSLLFLYILCVPYNVAFGDINLFVEAISLIAFIWCLFNFADSPTYVDKRFLPIAFFLLWEIISTFLNCTGILGIIRTNIKFVTISYLMLILIKSRPEKVFKDISTLFAIIMVFQLFSYVTKIFGYSNDQSSVNKYNYFLGIRVNINKVVLFAIYICYVYSLLDFIKGRIKVTIVGASGIIFAVAEKVSTSIVGIGIFCLFFIGAFIFKNKKFWVWVLYCLLVFAIGFAFIGRTEQFAFILENILHESVTLNGRTLLWQQAIEKLNGIHWIIGYGYGHKHTFSIGSFVVDRAHNQYLSTIFNYGIIGIALYFCICSQEIKQVGTSTKTSIRAGMIGVLASMFIIQIPASTIDMPYYYVFHMIMVYSDLLISKKSIDICHRKRNYY